MSRSLWVAAFWIALAVCTYLALTPSPPDAVTAFSDVVLHAFAFTVLTFLCSAAHFRLSYLAPALCMLAYGVALELAQGQIAERSAEFGDVLVDLVGIGVGLVLVRFVGAPAEHLLSWILNSLGLEERRG